MPVTIDGTTGVTTPGATVGAITGILKATSGVVSQAVAGTDYLTSTSGGAITLATAQTASGTAVDFTGIPSWVKRITVMFSGVSLSATANILVQLGTGSTTYTTSGYVSASSAGASIIGTTSSTAGFNIRSDTASQAASVIMTIVNITGNAWVSSHTGRQSGATTLFGGGDVSLGAVLTAVRITSTSTDTFDAGTINISYE